MECKICVNAYNSSNRPFVLQCGHSLCEFCLTKIRRSSLHCPFDRSKIKFFSPNYQLMSQINSLSHPPVFISPDQSHLNFQTCPQDHRLLFTENRLTELIKCNVCQMNFSTSSWYCDICDFDMCHHCFGSVLCYKGHLMENKHSGSFKCDACLGYVENEEAIRCESCDVDVCFRCSSLLKDIRRNEKRCDKGHKMKWKNNVSSLYGLLKNQNYYSCIKCQKLFTKIGSFSCLACKEDSCLQCSNSN